MDTQKRLKSRVRKAALGLFFVLGGFFASLLLPLIPVGMDILGEQGVDRGRTTVIGEEKREKQSNSELKTGSWPEIFAVKQAYAVPDENSGQQTDENGNPIQGNGQNSDGNAGNNQSNDSNQNNGNNGGTNGNNGGANGNGNNGGNGENNGQNGNENTEGENANTEENANTGENTATENATTEKDATASCEKSLGAIGWLVCPATGVVAQAADWLYDRIQGILVINPVKMEDGSPIYEIWKYFLGLTNIVFALFLLVVIYSQLTGWGISNYGLKRALPKLIVTAMMVNLSFLICSIAVDVSNIVGMGIRQLFTSIEETVTQNANMQMSLGLEGIFGALGGAGLAVGAGVIAFETGAIWMLIPMVFGALVAVVVGLITIALRQAVVALLVMISPLAMVCCILPNTEGWFNKWKQLLIQMLVFYPLFSLLFGASALAGFAIIYSATDGFGLILGAAVQTLPLFMAWSLMKMSGTFLEGINARLRGLTAGPQRGIYAMADRRRQLSGARHLAGRPYTPSLRLMQFMSNRRIAQGEELSQHQETIKNRGLAYRAGQNYRRDGSPSRLGRRTYGEMADNLNYQRAVTRDQNNMNRGLEALAASGAMAGTLRAQRQAKERARLAALDNKMIDASDFLKAEQARGDKIEYDNAMGYHKRMTDMMNAHYDAVNGFERVVDEDGNEVLTPRAGYVAHKDVGAADLARYNAINKIMDGNLSDMHVAAAKSAQEFDTQQKIMGTKMEKYFDLTVPTRDIDLALSEMTRSNDAIHNIDSIVAGMRVLNQRGDLDLVKTQLENVMDGGRLEVGTHASQALGNFLMFEVKDRDPFLRRFGKYINLETAMLYSAGKRTKYEIDLDEMVKGEYTQIDPETGEEVVMKSKMGLPTLMLGTPLDGMERKALDNLETMLKHAYTTNGQLDVQAYLARRKEVEKSMAPAFISAALKFPSGSDQIKTMVSFLTGYDGKGNARWGAGGDLESDPGAAEDYFMNQTIGYIKSQTPTQILGLRSDFYDPLMQHFARAYELDEMEDWSEEDRERHAEMVAELADIQTRYGDLPAEEQAERRAADVKALRERMAAAEFREELEKMGKLEQIYRTRRSGAANNAKDWVRKWLGLDDEVAINERLRMTSNRRERQHEEAAVDAGGVEPEEEFGGFNARDRALFGAEIQSLYDDWEYLDGTDVDAFYEQTREYVERELRDVSDFILRQYEDYRARRPRASAQDLMLKLQELLEDENNY